MSNITRYDTLTSEMIHEPTIEKENEYKCEENEYKCKENKENNYNNYDIYYIDDMLSIIVKEKEQDEKPKKS